LTLAGCGSAEKRRALASAPAVAPAPAENAATPPAATEEQAARPAPSPPPSAPQEDPAISLLKRVNAIYGAGVKDYDDGNLDKAKGEFDQAVSLLLESKLDIQANDRLDTEFNQLVENIYDMEIAALERGDTLSSHTYEPAPIESFAGLTFPVDPNARARAQQELATVTSDLPLVSNDYVSGALSYLQTHARHYIQTVLDRRGYYGPMIEQTLRKEGLPQDLIYLAAGESAFNPFAVSRKGAKGIWQFMLGTAELYGLHKNRWVDEREDPVKSTEAAARHLKDLYNTFGDWFLAMAAYDWNPAGVQKAIEKTGYADYWKLRELNALPAETENYVPVFVAIALIAKDPQAYGFQVPDSSNMAADHVTVTEPTDLRLVAGLIDHPVEDLIQLNPSLLTWVTPPNASGFTLNLPAGTKDEFERAIGAVPAARRKWWRAYRVESGDTLASVARKYHISTASLAEANHLSVNDPPDVGSHLLLPLGRTSEASLVRVHERSVFRARRYRIKPGDTLELVADHFDVTPYQIRHWNHLRSSKLVAGRSLTVFVRVPVRSSGNSRRRRRRITPGKHVDAHSKPKTHSKEEHPKLARSSGARTAASSQPSR
jgi:peptidoglycan lytic transglycosylase D